MSSLQPAEQAFVRRLFLCRYARLLQKVEQTYPAVSADPELQARLRERILNLTWVDVGVERLAAISHERATGAQQRV